MAQQGDSDISCTKKAPGTTGRKESSGMAIKPQTPRLWVGRGGTGTLGQRDLIPGQRGTGIPVGEGISAVVAEAKQDFIPVERDLIPGQRGQEFLCQRDRIP